MPEPSPHQTAHEPTFGDLGLTAPLLKALDAVGYETPTPIQARTIPLLLEGRDLLGHAPTGTGKTAAFALPLLARVDVRSNQVQVMVLTPTRELAIQVAEALQKYAAFIPGFHVLPIYGGQEYGGQIKQLRRGVHAVVGTPGRVMDHMRKGTLQLDHLQALVLDEADEMLRMGFLDDVEWILQQMPAKRQMALFSATMPKEVQRIARQHLNNPEEVAITSKTATAATIRQRYWSVTQTHKLDALTRILEVEPFEAMLIFVRTKIATTELADRLAARGYSAAAINGDMVQKQREQMIQRLTRGSLDILVATDVAARGLDVDRISHVVNYDIPYDTEAYIHRIGRTGRAGRLGDAILFVSPREQRMLAAIERATRQKIEKLVLPTTEMVNNKRIADFKQTISDTLAAGGLEFMQGILEQYRQDHDLPSIEIAAALAKLALGDKLLLLEDKPARTESQPERQDRQPRQTQQPPANRQGATDRPLKRRESTHETASDADQRPRRDKRADRGAGRKGLEKPPEGMERFRIEVGRVHDVKPGNIVGAIANEAGLDGEHIGHIEIYDDHCLIDLPSGMPKDIFQGLKRVIVAERPLNITRYETFKKERRLARAQEKGDAPPHQEEALAAKPKKNKAGKRKANSGSAKAPRKRPANPGPRKPANRD
ncbi:MAG: DEAD/DEAH box helicase [Pseudomonadota bacterium]